MILTIFALTRPVQKEESSEEESDDDDDEDEVPAKPAPKA